MATDYTSMSDDDLFAALPKPSAAPAAAPAPAVQATTAAAPVVKSSPDFSSMSDDDLFASLTSARARAQAAPGSAAQSAPVAPANSPEAQPGIARGFGMGVLRGAKDVIDTGAQALASGFDKLAGTKEGERVRAMNDAGKAEFKAEYGDSTAADIGRVTGQVAATMPVGGFLAKPVQALAKTRAATGVEPLLEAGAQALKTGGFRVGELAGTKAGMAMRVAGGAATGGASVAAVNPDDAAAGAALGAVLPGAVKAVGMAGRKAVQVARGPEMPAAHQAAVKSAQEAGYVLPPTHARPTLVNRLVEGVAGKLTTAQNASVRNQETTNALVKKATGLTELSPEGIAAARAEANSAYDALGKVGRFRTDAAFKSALDRVGAGSKSLAQDFPELANAEADKLLASFAGKEGFNAQSTIEAIKRLRFDGSANKAGQDPAAKALGSAQMKVAAALEDLVERNLDRAGSVNLLRDYRAARTNLARLYDVEKALNTSTGNVDAHVLGRAAKKGRPLTGELKQVADAAQAFPAATRATEKAGSLPQLSPLDWAAAAAGGAGLGPVGAAGLVARPALRAVALSGPVQRRLAQAPAAPGPVQQLAMRRTPDAIERLARVAPVVVQTGRDQ